MLHITVLHNPENEVNFPPLVRTVGRTLNWWDDSARAIAKDILLKVSQ
jgi:hypothetical protein